MVEKKKQFVSDNNKLMSEWNSERNSMLQPDKIAVNSGKKVWWKCNQGHEWQAIVQNRNKGSGCPYCSGFKAIEGKNDLKTVNPDLAKEWNHKKNGSLTPENVTANSNKRVWWKCNKGHEWQATIHSRNKGTGCPYCSGRYSIKGENDLKTVNPKIAAEWDYVKNIGISPEDVLPNSGKKVWWKCNKGHEWITSIHDRNKGNGCPYCGGRKVLKGFNDLKTVNPDLAKEWNYEKNQEITPEDVMPNSGKKVWWKCNKGHEWQQKIYHRNNGVNCPICKSERNTSLPEFAFLYYLRNMGIDAIHSYKSLGYELDIFIPSKRIAIEYDGYYWHKDKINQDKEKNNLCKKNGIKLYRIREGLPTLKDYSIDYVIERDKRGELEKVIRRIILEITGKKVNINIKKDAIDIENMRSFIEKDNSINSLNPVVAKEWNYEKNGGLKPEFFAANSGKVVWWKCNKGHEWQTAIQNRNKGSGCPYCSGRNAIEGENDLKTVNPILAAEWNYDRNHGLTPEEVLPNSDKNVWWKCKQGHEWKSTIGNRNRGNGCPYCGGRKVLKGFNDLKTVNPDLAKEWNYKRNIELVPEKITFSSNKNVWWKCNQGHEWRASVYARYNGTGCPYCGGKKVLKGFNDLGTANPELAAEWNYEKNGDLVPDAVTPNSNKRVWWRCKACGYEWETSICNRNLQNTSCPKCAKKKTASALSYHVIQQTVDNKFVSEYSSVVEAARQTGVNRTSIIRVCNGKQKTAGGYIWKYDRIIENRMF